MGEHAKTLAFDQSGRALGPRAMKTRERLLEATEKQLQECSVRDVAVVDITREAGTSPATFYQYFKDVTEAVLHLAERVSEELAISLQDVDDEWFGEAGLDNARRMMRHLLRTWDEHRSLLLARNIIADEGDRRFHRARRKAMAPLIGRVAKQVLATQRADRLAKEINPTVAAIGIVAMIERLATYSEDLVHIGVTREDLIETCARIVQDAMARS
jgi:AcrR family transcriptional regulator